MGGTGDGTIQVGKVVSGKFFPEFFSGYMGAGKKGKERDLDQNIAEVS